MPLRKTKNNPCIYFANAEGDYQEGLESKCPGLAAGFLNTKQLNLKQRSIWQAIFDSDWEQTCQALAADLFHIGIDSFAIVPCSRLDVVEGIRKGFTKAGMAEVQDFIKKTTPHVSYAKKNSTYIAQNTRIDYDSVDLELAKKIAICDDFSDTGKTLFGLYSTIMSNGHYFKPELYLCSIGISKFLEDGM